MAKTGHTHAAVKNVTLNETTMSKKSPQSNIWNFGVTQLRMTHPRTGVPLGNVFGNFRDDTGECLGTTSEQYGVLQNSDLMDTARAALEQRGLTDYKERILTAGSCGQRFYAEFTFANKQLANRVGDVFGYRLTLQNSFDCSLRASLVFGLQRLTCLNGASTVEKQLDVTQKHSPNVSVNFLGGAIDTILANGARAMAVFDSMADAPLSDEQGLVVLENFVQGGVLTASLREPIKTLWLAPRRQEDKARNIYNLYNAVTEHLTHKVSGERYEYASGVTQDVLFRLVNAVRNPAKLAALLTVKAA